MASEISVPQIWEMFHYYKTTSTIKFSALPQSTTSPLKTGYRYRPSRHRVLVVEGAEFWIFCYWEIILSSMRGLRKSCGESPAKDKCGRSKQTLNRCWLSVGPAGPTLNQHRFNDCLHRDPPDGIEPASGKFSVSIWVWKHSVCWAGHYAITLTH